MNDSNLLAKSFFGQGIKKAPPKWGKNRQCKINIANYFLLTLLTALDAAAVKLASAKFATCLVALDIDS